MKLILDQEAKQALSVLADAALKAGGLQLLETVNKINAGCEEYKEPDTKE